VHEAETSSFHFSGAATVKTRNYDSTVARIAGNILSGIPAARDEKGRLLDYDPDAAYYAVRMARLIIAEVKRTEPVEEPPQ
jgi:hypothetical protein